VSLGYFKRVKRPGKVSLLDKINQKYKKLKIILRGNRCEYWIKNNDMI